MDLEQPRAHPKEREARNQIEHNPDIIVRNVSHGKNARHIREIERKQSEPQSKRRPEKLD